MTVGREFLAAGDGGDILSNVVVTAPATLGGSGTVTGNASGTIDKTGAGATIAPDAPPASVVASAPR